LTSRLGTGKPLTFFYSVHCTCIRIVPRGRYLDTVQQFLTISEKMVSKKNVALRAVFLRIVKELTKKNENVKS